MVALGATLSDTPVANIKAGFSVRTETGPTYDVALTDGAVLADATGAPITITLPEASTADDMYVVIKKIDSSSNAVTVDGYQAETIEGTATSVLATQYESVTVICDGTEWFIWSPSATAPTDAGDIVHSGLTGLSNDDHSQYYNDARIETLLDGYTTDAEFSSHTGDATIHFTESSVDASAIDASAFGANEIPFSNGSNLLSESDFTYNTVPNTLNVESIMTTGTVDVIHTATFTNDHALEIDLNADGYGDVKALNIDYITGPIGAGDDEATILVNVDETDSTGGDITALEVLATDEGVGQVNALLVGATINPLEQLSGTFIDMDSALVNAVDRLTEFTTPGSDIVMFVANSDTVTIGSAARFEEIEFVLDTVASGGGIAPSFEFSTGIGTWANFSPVDGTNGLRTTGVMAWLDSDIPSWATGLGTEFLIRITRTRNSLSTSPIESLVQIAATTLYSWDLSGDLTVNDISAADIVVSGTVDGRDVATDGTNQDTHIADGTIHFTEGSIDHGSIAGLTDDDHIHYFNDVRLDPVLDGYATLSGQTYTPTNVSTDRAFNANASSVNELADVLGTLIADLQGTGIIS